MICREMKEDTLLGAGVTRIVSVVRSGWRGPYLFNAVPVGLGQVEAAGGGS